jgi:hypothetical protein
MELGASWSVKTIEGDPDGASVTIVNAEGKPVVLDVSSQHPDAPPSEPLGPFGVAGARVTYRLTEVPFTAFEPVARELVRRMQSAAGGDLGGALKGWLPKASRDQGTTGGGTSTPAQLEIQRFGPFGTGDALAREWTVRRINVEGKRVKLLAKRKDQEVLFYVSPDPQDPSGPFDTKGVHIFYGKTELPLSSFEAAGRALAQRLADAAAGKDLRSAVEQWISAGRAPSPLPRSPRGSD